MLETLANPDRRTELCSQIMMRTKGFTGTTLGDLLRFIQNDAIAGFPTGSMVHQLLANFVQGHYLHASERLVALRADIELLKAQSPAHNSPLRWGWLCNHVDCLPHYCSRSHAGPAGLGSRAYGKDNLSRQSIVNQNKILISLEEYRRLVDRKHEAMQQVIRHGEKLNPNKLTQND